MKKRLFIFLAPFVAVGVLGALYFFLSWALSAGPSIRYAVGATAIATMISIWWWAAGELVSSDRGSDTPTEAQSADMRASSSASLEQPHASARTA